MRFTRIDPRKPAPAEAPEVRQSAIALAAQIRVCGDNRERLERANGCQRARTNLSIDIYIDSPLKQTRRACNAVIDASIKVEQRERRRQHRTTSRLPIPRVIDLCDRVIGYPLQLFNEPRTG